MRLFVLCAAAVLASGQALAGSIDGSALRGSATAAYDGEPVARPERYVPASPSYWRWQGVYVGGHAGIAGTGMDFSSGTPALVASILSHTVVGPHVSDWTVLSKIGDTRGPLGGFVGYNSQWDGNLILGVEGNYSRVLKAALAAPPPARCRAFLATTRRRLQPTIFSIPLPSPAAPAPTS